MAKKNDLTKEQIESIKNYASNIKTLKNFTEMVRQAKGMYIGYLGNRGFERMFREVFQNGIDELQRKDSPCDHVNVTYDENTITSIVEDNGRGIPFNNIIRVFTKQHTSSNYNKEEWADPTSGVNGVGAKVTNALSSKFVVESYVLGEGRKVEFDEGYPWDKGEQVIPNKENRQGTIVLFTPSFSEMGEITTSCEDILKIIRSISPLTNIGSVINFKGILKSGKETNLSIVNEDGLMGIIIDICNKPLIKPIVFGDMSSTMNCNILVTYDISEGGDYEDIRSYANFCPTDSAESSHVKGFIAGIKKFIIPYMNKIYLNSINSKGKKNKKPLTITEADIRTGLRAVVNANHLEPNFTGQAKDILAMDDVEAFVAETTLKYMEEWSKTNPHDLQKLCKYLKEIATLRISMDNKKVKLQNQFNSVQSGLPSKFVAPTETWKELFICEGDSAGGSIENHRHNPTQGVFPIRGMIINCFDNTEKKCLENAEVAGILSIIGGGYGKNFDLSKVKWEKIIIASDADSAGAFIASLLLRMVLKFCPQLIEDGRFYRAIPPLYCVNNKGKKVYFTNKIDIVQHIQKLFTRNNTLETLNHKKLTSKEVEKLLYNNYDYIYTLEKVANKYRISPAILEIYLNNIDKTPDQICKLIKKRYRFMDKVVINGHTTCDGIADGISNTLIMGDRMIEECKPILDIMKGNLYNSYILNGTESTILDIMTEYKKCEPSNLTRLKGLGEQKAEELAVTTIYPGDMGNRVLMRYTMESAVDEINKIREFESNKSLLLKDLVVTRMDITD
ncbi:toprim domain-containing protein [uncultured Clostridium sp.]|uniref:toprim domain-containing protein n=1 Tax=uncultured Clostridium sp. TaxID=59620 RepID=UPI00263BCC2D|nr:toprim domain-containing protein [uncultured Clostridium sp.]